jgi:hypothetical protein
LIAFPRSRLAPYAWVLPPLVAVLLVYLPDVGHGFIKDDFAWIRASRISGARDLLALFGKDNGFYRPLVSLTFAVDHRLFGLHPFGYGLTNLVLLLADAGLLVALGRTLGMPAGTAVFAAAVWTLDPHGIPMAVLWISGRTALVLTLFALLSAVAFVRGRPGLAACCALAAMLAKEEAVLLPLVLLAWSRRLPQPVKRAWLPLLALIPYLLLRARTGAYLPFTAPAFYRPSLDPALVARNVFEYADRACTFGVLVVLLACLLCWRRPRLDGPLERSWVVLGVIWLVAGYGLTVFLPVRSSLYACFPSVGSALAAAACAQSVWNASPDSRRRLRAAAVIVPLLLVPIHWSRAARWVRPAELTERTLADLASAPPAPGVVVVLHDAPGGRASLSNAFGTLIEDAVRSFAGDETARVWIDPPPPDWEGAGLRPPEPGQPARHFVLRNGRLVLVR